MATQRKTKMTELHPKSNQELRQRLVKQIEKDFDLIVSKWVGRLQDKIESYAKRPKQELCETTSEHLHALLQVIRNNDYQRLRSFIHSIVPLRISHNFPISGVQQSFFIGKNILCEKIFSEIIMSTHHFQQALKLIEEPFERAMMEYSDYYDHLEILKAEKRTRHQEKLEQEKRFLSQIKTEKEKLEHIISALGADIALINSDLNIEWWYSNFEEGRGVRSDCIGESCQILPWHVVERCDGCPTLKTFQSARMERGRIEILTENDIKKVYQIISTPVMNHQGTVDKVLELVQDVTNVRELERKIDEQQVFLSAIADDAVDAIVGLTIDGSIISWNRGAEKLFGFTSDEVIDKNISQIIPELHFGENGHKKKECDETKSYASNFEIKSRSKTGAELLLDITRSVIRDNRKKILGASLVVRDVTNRRRQEEKRLQTERMAMVGQMAAKVAHEMRNPLSSISLNSELLEDEIVSFDQANVAEARELLRSIVVEVDRLAQLSDEYLRFSKLPALKLTQCDMNKIIVELIRFHKKELSRKNIEIINHFDNESIATKIDKEQFPRALLNLFRNAAEAMPNGGTIEVSTHQQNGYIQVSVKDDGIGISDDDMQNIFNPFFSTKSVGTGLGLSITRQIVEEHGGLITCHSQEGEGTTFIIRMPIGAKEIKDN